MGDTPGKDDVKECPEGGVEATTYGTEEKPGLMKTWKTLFHEGHEISDLIFSLLDIESFLACRLVCKDWKQAVSTYRPKWREIKETPLVKAVKFNRELGAHVLIANGADVSAQDEDKIEEWLYPNHNYYRDVSKMTPLHWAARNGLTSVAEHLIATGANLEALDHFQSTPLCWASKQGQAPMVKLLLANGADVDAGGDNKTDESPLVIASYQGHEAVVKLLLESGANVHFKADENETPIRYASGRFSPDAHWDSKNCKASIVEMLISKEVKETSKYCTEKHFE